MKKNLLYAALCAAVLSAGSLAVHAEGDPAAAVPAVVYGADENETPIIPAEEKKVGLVFWHRWRSSKSWETESPPCMISP